MIVFQIFWSRTIRVTDIWPTQCVHNLLKTLSFGWQSIGCLLTKCLSSKCFSIKRLCSKSFYREPFCRLTFGIHDVCKTHLKHYHLDSQWAGCRPNAFHPNGFLSKGAELPKLKMFEMCQNMERNRIKAWKVFSENTFETREPKWRHDIHPKDTRNNLLDQGNYCGGT